LYSGIHARMSKSVTPVKRAAAGITRKHPRISIFAASAAAAGVLGAAGFAVASAPWAQAAVQSGSHSTSGQSGATLFDAMNGAKTGGVQLDSLRSAATGGTTADFGHSTTHHPARPAVAQTTPKHAPAKHAAARPAAAKHAAAKHAPAKPAAAKHAAKKAAPENAAKPKQYLIYDSVTPSSIPAGKAAAVYANGAYAASPSQVSHHHHVLWIDTNGSNPGANALDVEPGDATPAGAAAWVQQRLIRHPDSVAIVYTMLSQWQQVKQHVAHLPSSMQSKVRYWIADPTGVPHIVPGSNATQWYWGANYDITTANPSFTSLG
jgi:hypothetical protein